MSVERLAGSSALWLSTHIEGSEEAYGITNEQFESVMQWLMQAPVMGPNSPLQWRQAARIVERLLQGFTVVPRNRWADFRPQFTGTSPE